MTIFDEGVLHDSIPDQGRSFGIERVFINGHQVLSGGVLDAASMHFGKAMKVM